MDFPEVVREEVVVGDKTIIIDTHNMMFNEATLSDFFQKAHAWYDYIGRAMAEQEAIVQVRKMELDQVYGERFIAYRESDSKMIQKVCEGKTDGDIDVLSAKQSVIQANRILQLLKLHLRAWDKAFDAAQSTGHMLRKEMDKLGYDIKVDPDLDTKIGEALGR